MNILVTRNMLLEHVWDLHFDPHTTVVESHVSRLRAKLDRGWPGPRSAATARGKRRKVYEIVQVGPSPSW